MAIVSLILQMYIDTQDRWSRYRLSALLFTIYVQSTLPFTKSTTSHVFIETRSHRSILSDEEMMDSRHLTMQPLDVQDWL